MNRDPGVDPKRRQMAYTAAAMYGGAAVVSLVEGLIPGGPSFSLVPGFVALVAVSSLVVVGPRLPLFALAALGPLGAAMIAIAIGSTVGPNDGAVLFIWPVLWTTYFFGRKGAIGIVLWVGLVDALAQIAMPAGVGHADRWFDVMVGMAVVAAVVHWLTNRNEELVGRLATEARTDKLTGLLNRRGFEERVEVELARARRENASIGVASFDIDHFKGINDEWGHEVGDRVLAGLGDVFRAQTRDTDVVARMGGEEFLVLLVASDSEHAGALAERVRAAFATELDPDLPHVTISAGVTTAPAPATIEPLIQIADSALYKAKAAGRNRTIVDPRTVPVAA